MRCISLLIVAATTLSVASSALSQATGAPPRIQDIVDVIYEFDVAPDGTPHNFKVSRCFRPNLSGDASGALSAAEKAQGAAIIAHHRYSVRPDQVSKKRYEFLLFDTVSRHFSWGIRPRKT